MKKIKFLIVGGLELLCGFVDRIPRYHKGKWYRHGSFGCYPFRLALLSSKLEDRWATGWWREP